MIDTATGDGYSESLGTFGSDDMKPDYPVPREPAEKRIGELMNSQNAQIMPQINTRLALTILGLMLLFSGMIVVGTLFLASISVKPLQATITKLLYKQ